MQLGTFEIPEKRLVPHAISDIKIIYDSIQNEPTKSMDIASLLGYKHATASPYYLRLKALTAFGLLEGRSKYKVSELGKKLAYPENDEQLKENKAKAVLNVGLWKIIYDKYTKSPPKENFWVQIKNITEIEPKKAKSVESLILKWYKDDIAHVSDDFTVIEKNDDQDQHLSQSSPQGKQMSQQIGVPQTSSLGRLTVPNMGNVEISDEDTIAIARSYLNVLEKKIKQKMEDESKSAQEIIKEEQEKFDERMEPTSE